MKPLGVFVVVDDLRHRRFVVDAVEDESELRLVAVASDIENAIRRAGDRHPDLIVISGGHLDPVAGARLRAFAAEGDTPALIVDVDFSAEQEDRRGPNAVNRRRNIRMHPGNLSDPAFRSQLGERLMTIARQLRESRHAGIRVAEAPRKANRHPVELVCIGSSTGGPEALATVLASLPADFRSPIMITQHMPGHFVDSLVSRLDEASTLTVKAAEHDETLQSGFVYVAPGDRHLLLNDFGVLRAKLADFGPVQSCRPAVDPLFTSCARLGSRVLGVILTGMGVDGLDGSRAMHARGASIIAQDEATSSVWGMPGAVTRAGITETVLPLDQIAPALVARVGRGTPLGAAP